MKKVAKNILYALVLPGAIMLITSLFYHIPPEGEEMVNYISAHSDNLEDLLLQLEENSSVCPYGKPVYGSLRWEGDSAFLNMSRQYGTTLRMSAYQIVLHDPLPGEKSNAVLAADLLAGKVVEPGAYFSFNQVVGPYSKERGFKEGPAYSGSSIVNITGGGVCKVATTLYNAAVLANLDILERHTHSMLVPYVFPGQDATVAYGVMDLAFKNNMDHPLIIWAGSRENTLTVAIYGSSYPPKITWHHELLSWQKKHTVYRYNPNLQPEEEKTIITGSGSVTVKVWITVEYFDGTLVTKDLGTRYYNPMPRVIEKKGY